MRKLLWWHVAVVGTAVALAAVLMIEGAPAPLLVGALCSIAALVAGWFVFGPHADASRASAIALIAVAIIASGVGTAFFPTVAILQVIAFPLIWFFGGNTRTAVIANVLLAIAVSIGFLVSMGTTPANLVQTPITETISLGMSLALGLWFSHVYDMVHERQRLIDALESAQSQVARLGRDAGAAEERERLTRELHDTIAQDLTGLVMTAERGRRELRAGNLEGADGQLAILEENARNALSDTRALVASGAALGVDGVGLDTSLHRLAERFGRETGITVAVSADEPGRLSRDAQVVLLRCAQEALANVRKHSGATTAALSLQVRDGAVELTVSDNGHGFDTSRRSEGFGLDGMRDRLALVDGTLSVTAGEKVGTTLAARLPAAVGASS